MTRFSRIALLSTVVLGLTLPAADAGRRVRHVRHPANAQVFAKLVHVERAQYLKDLRAAWTQYGPKGGLEVRAVMAGPDCPGVVIDLQRHPMKARASADDRFPMTCSAVIPAGTKQAALAFTNAALKSPPPGPDAGLADTADWLKTETGVPVPAPRASEADWHAWRVRFAEATKPDLVPLPLPVSDPQRILVFGDTGCRIKGTALQDCSDPEAWPLARIAAEAAKLRPDLVIHVGDYLYRENACPADFKGCTGTPWGDNWPTWDADFFAPAKPLLAAAPWVILRGNHEDCQRAGPGYLRLLGSQPFDPAAACSDHEPQYSIPLDRLTLVVEDNADAPETEVVAKAVPAYRDEIAALAKEKAPVWWLQHRPIWGLISGPLGLPIGGNLTMMAGLGPQGIPSTVELMLAGHIHTFEAINYDPENHVPPQIVAGFGGDMLDVTPSSLKGAVFQGSSGVHVKDGVSIGGFGFLLMTRTENGWTIDVHDAHGRIERQCFFAAGRVDCPVPKRR